MSYYQPLVFLAGVLMGTGSTITVKVMYGMQAVGLSGELQRFEKPLLTTWIMFVAMTCALPMHYVMEWRQHRQAAEYHRLKGAAVGGSSAGVAEVRAPEPVPWRTLMLLVIPSCFDLLGTGLASIGLLFTTVSVYQLVRCSVIIVTALLKATVLKHRLSSYMWLGIAINTVAMVLVSLTSFLPGASADASAEDDGIDRDPRVGILFILLSCLVQGSQYVFEERVMTVDNAPPLVVVGMEGLWGSLLMPIVVFPWAYILPGSDVGGCLENIYDSWVMTCNSGAIQLILAVFTLTVFLYNIFCIYVTFLLSSIWHAILDNFRPVSVWMTDLLLFYVFTSGTFGERWTYGSWIELLGMLLLFLGTAIYNGTVKVPSFDYDTIEEGDDDESEPLASSHSAHHPPSAGHRRSGSIDISSPMMTRSPLVTRQMARSVSPHSHVARDLSAEFGPPSLSLGGHNGGSRDDFGGGGAGYGSLNSAHKLPSSRATHSKSRGDNDRA